VNSVLSDFSLDHPSSTSDQTHIKHQLDSPLSTSKAENWAKFWIEQNPGKFPVERDRKLLAELAKEKLEMIEEAFGKILTTRAVREEKCIFALAINKPEMRATKRDQLFIIDPKSRHDAAEWVTRQATKCPAWHEEPVPPEEAQSRIYRCTVGCEKTFEKKDSWRKHEELRFPQRGWVQSCHDSPD